MDKRRLPLLLIAAMILPIIGVTYPVHAAGQLYISPGVTAVQSSGSTFQVLVKVANIDPFNTYDVQVAADNHVINPTDLSVGGNIFAVNATGGTPFELVHCINGVGSGCVSSKDGPGIVHSEFSYFGRGVNASGSGLLFTITYQVVSANTFSQIHIQNDVLAIGGKIVVHTTTDGSYGLAPDFSVAANPLSIDVASGSSNATIISVTALNGFTGTVSLAVQSVTGLTAILNPTSVNSAGSSMLTISASPTIAPATYNVNVTGSSGSLNHETTVPVTVTPPNVVPPALTQINWKHRLQLSKDNFVQAWKFGIINEDNSTTIYVRLQISAIDNSGTASFTVISNVIQLSPAQNSVGNTLVESFTTADVGASLTFTATIFWGTTVSAQPFSSTANVGGIPTSGSFTVLP